MICRKKSSPITAAGVAISHPGAFICAAIFTALWLTLRPDEFDWQGVATVATLFIALFIQRATHRDTQALHAKVDELIHATAGARNAIAQVDNRELEEIEQHRPRRTIGLTAPRPLNF